MKKDEITEYVISKIILPKVLLLRDIPTLRTLLFIFNLFLERSNLLVLYVKLTQWYSEFECLWWKGWSRIYSVAWSCDCRWLHPNMVPVTWLTGIGEWGNYFHVRKNIDNKRLYHWTRCIGLSHPPLAKHSWRVDTSRKISRGGEVGKFFSGHSKKRVEKIFPDIYQFN